MAMGTRRRRQHQQELFYTGELAEVPGHPFYAKLNAALEDADFDAFCEQRCQAFYHDRLGRPSLTPGSYFRLQLIGFFEGVGSERGIGRSVADSLSLRSFLGCGLDEATPDHVTLSRTRRGGRRRADRCGVGPASGSPAQEEGLEPGLAEPPRPRGRDHEDEGRPHAAGLQGRRRWI